MEVTSQHYLEGKCERKDLKIERKREKEYKEKISKKEKTERNRKTIEKKKERKQ